MLYPPIRNDRMPVFVPKEWIDDILCRVPVKTLLRFTTVCKSWHSLIKSSAFISTHQARRCSSNVNQKNELFLIKFIGGQSGLYLDNQQQQQQRLEEYKSLNTILSGIVWYVRGSCQGLVYLSKWRCPGEKFLWNPLINRFLAIPDPPQTCRGRRGFDVEDDFPASSMDYFGYDFSTKDYKVIKLGWSYGQVFSLNSRSWKVVRSVPSDIRMGFPPPMTFVNGRIYCLGLKSRPLHNFVAEIDVDSDTSRELMLPESLAHTDFLFYLNIFAYKESSIGMTKFDERTRRLSEMWVMKQSGVAEPSWTLLLKMDELSSFPRLILSKENGELIFDERVSSLPCWELETGSLPFNSDSPGLISCDPNSKKAKKLAISDAEFLRVLNIYPYVESLVLLDVGSSSIEFEELATEEVLN